jgi:hypothetical protein
MSEPIPIARRVPVAEHAPPPAQSKTRSDDDSPSVENLLDRILIWYLKFCM